MGYRVNEGNELGSSVEYSPLKVNERVTFEQFLKEIK